MSEDYPYIAKRKDLILRDEEAIVNISAFAWRPVGVSAGICPEFAVEGFLRADGPPCRDCRRHSRPVQRPSDHRPAG